MLSQLLDSRAFPWAFSECIITDKLTVEKTQSTCLFLKEEKEITVYELVLEVIRRLSC